MVDLYADFGCVCEGECPDDYSNEYCPKASWYVSYVDDDGELWSIGVRFARKRDVDIVISYLKKEGWTVEKLHALPLGSGQADAIVRDAIAAALPW